MRTFERVSICHITNTQASRAYLGFLWLPIFIWLLATCLAIGVSAPLSIVNTYNAFIFCVALITVYIVHEAIHYLAFLSSKVDRKCISIKLNPKNLSIDMSCSRNIPISTWRYVLALPCLLLTPVLILATTQSSSPAFFGLITALAVSGCAYDLALLLALKGVPRDLLVAPRLQIEGKNLLLVRHPMPNS